MTVATNPPARGGPLALESDRAERPQGCAGGRPRRGAERGLITNTSRHILASGFQDKETSLAAIGCQLSGNCIGLKGVLALHIFFILSLMHSKLATAAKLGFVPAALIVSLVVPSQAHALSLGYQLTPTQPFQTFGTDTTNNVLTFPGFNTSAIPPSHVGATLVGYQYYLPSVMLSGVSRLICDDLSTTPVFSCPLPGPFPATATVSFDSIVPGGSAVSIPAINASIAGPATTGFTNNAISGSASDVFSTNTALFPPGPYTNTPVSLDFYKTAWAYTGPSGVSTQFLGTAFPPAVRAVVSGQLGIRYVYSYVPGPLPLLGAGAAFGWSRRLRRRITRTV